jgi:hypothetical protein
MTLKTCSRQSEVRALTTSGHWPHACPEELRAHLSECRSCAEMLKVTLAFQQARATTAAQAQLPAAGAIWWRAQLRRRNAALQRVGKPILGGYAFAMVVTVAAASVGLIGNLSHRFHWFDWLMQPGFAGAHTEPFSLSAWLSSGGSLAVLIPVFATLALVGALVAYLWAER